MSVPLWLWFAVLAVIVVMLALDLLARPGERVASPREADLSRIKNNHGLDASGSSASSAAPSKPFPPSIRPGGPS